MSFTDQKPRIATKEDLKAPWGGYKDGRNFRCVLCGYRFKIGDYWRWQYTNSTPGAYGNPIVCKKCDGTKEEIEDRMRTLYREAKEIKERMWWFFRSRDD